MSDLQSASDDEAAIRTALWESTDAAFKSAQAAYSKLNTERDVKLADEDKSDYFSVEKPSVYLGQKAPFDVDVVHAGQ